MNYHNDIKNAKSRGHIIHSVFFAYFKELFEQNSYTVFDKDPTGLIRLLLQYFGRSYTLHYCIYFVGK